MRDIIVALVVVLGSQACMRDAVQEARPTEPSGETSTEMNAPAASPNAPAFGLLEAPADAPEEFGAVHWGRSLDAALAASAQSGKPVFLLFTEVPGCSTVKGFANGALRHPLLVEAIEDEFEPVVVRNNVGGKEREILNSFNEPTWNNPVVRFLDADRKDLVKRYARGWTVDGLATSMVAALRAADRPVPPYLENLVVELTAETESTVFSMYCFWTGEVKLAGLDGVVSTRPGFANGREVVRVIWDRRRTNPGKLFGQAAAADAATGVLVTDETQKTLASKHFDHVATLSGELRFSEKDDKYQIRRRDWGWVPMTPAQATAVNRAVVRSDEEVARILSPRQIAFSKSDRKLDVASSVLRPPNQ